jgi:hypothetical protein
VFENGPTVHETLHHWSMLLDSSFGFDNARSHWGASSADGVHGGFDRSTVICRATGRPPTGTPPACPLDGGGRMRVRTAPFSCCLTDMKLMSPIELYLMGLVPANQVAPLWVMDSPMYEGPVFADAGSSIVAMNYSLQRFRIVTVEDIIAKHGVRPPATQRDFRGAFVLVTPQPATQAQLERVARWARRFSGEEKAPASLGVISFSEATRGLATMVTRLRPP